MTHVLLKKKKKKFCFSFYVPWKRRRCILNTWLNVAETLNGSAVRKIPPLWPRSPSPSPYSQPLPRSTAICASLCHSQFTHTGYSRSGLHRPLILLIEYELGGGGGRTYPTSALCVCVWHLLFIWQESGIFGGFVYVWTLFVMVCDT